MSPHNPLRRFTVIVLETITYSYDVEASDRDAALAIVSDDIDITGFECLSFRENDWNFDDVLDLGPVEGGVE
jgi:hypothetical protein